MAGPMKPYYPPQESIPSQRDPGRVPFYPSQPGMRQVSELQKEHPQSAGAPPSVYVVSTYPSLPINAVAFNNQSGNHPLDTGWQPYATAPDPLPPYETASAFYEVPSGRVAIIRDWQALVVPTRGESVSGAEPPGVGNPIWNSLGASNTRFVIGFYVNGNPQQGMAPIITWGTPFGDVFGKGFVIGQEGDVLEMRLTGSAGGSQFAQALLAFNGDLLLAKGLEPQYEPGTTAVIPVHEGGA